VACASRPPPFVSATKQTRKTLETGVLYQGGRLIEEVQMSPLAVIALLLAVLIIVTIIVWKAGASGSLTER
jgi:hypothetical protein